jgi:hypothetical protein
MGMDDPYQAYCLDEAIAQYIGRIRSGQTPRPAKAQDNRALIEAMKGGSL